jgi:ABC-2 type transport system ATP-binding protein
MRLILDLIEATDGYIETDGKLVTDDVTWKEFTGSFIDGRFLIDFYTPEEYFNFIARVYGIDKDTLDSRLEHYQTLMHDEILGTKKYLRQFSEGNRQKTGIIGAMIINPKVLILDEPFNYLDPSSQITVAKLIRQMNEQLGTTVIISSHNLSFVSEISTRILLLEKGRIIKDLNNHDGSATKELEEYFNTAE